MPEAPAPEIPAVEQPSKYDEAIEAPDTFEPEPPAYSPPVAERVEEAVTRKATDRLQSIQVPREELEEAVRKAVREVVQEIAWEVVPELAEELIRAEIDKVKEALTRLKYHKVRTDPKTSRSPPAPPPAGRAPRPRVR